MLYLPFAMRESLLYLLLQYDLLEISLNTDLLIEFIINFKDFCLFFDIMTFF